MALVTTTLNGAVAIDANSITITSATGVTAGMFARVDDEVIQVDKTYTSGVVLRVLRGRDGSSTAVHPTGSNITFYLGTDTTTLAPQGINSFQTGGRVRTINSYNVAGAIAHPVPGTDMVAVLNGTSVLAMTLVSPTKDLDGSVLTVIGNGIAAHTVTYTTVGFGNVGGTADVMTFSATQQQGFQCMAMGGIWILIGPLAVATASVSGPSLA